MNAVNEPRRAEKPQDPDEDPDESRWQVVSSVRPQGDAGVRWVQLTFARSWWDDTPPDICSRRAKRATRTPRPERRKSG